MIFFNEQTMNTKQYSLEQIIEMANEAEFQYKLDQLDIAREDFELFKLECMSSMADKGIIDESITSINEGVFSTIGNIISAIFNAIKKFFTSIYNFIFGSSSSNKNKEKKSEDQANKEVDDHILKVAAAIKKNDMSVSAINRPSEENKNVKNKFYKTNNSSKNEAILFFKEGLKNILNHSYKSDLNNILDHAKQSAEKLQPEEREIVSNVLDQIEIPKKEVPAISIFPYININYLEKLDPTAILNESLSDLPRHLIDYSNNLQSINDAKSYAITFFNSYIPKDIQPSADTCKDQTLFTKAIINGIMGTRKKEVPTKKMLQNLKSYENNLLNKMNTLRANLDKDENISVDRVKEIVKKMNISNEENTNQLEKYANVSVLMCYHYYSCLMHALIVCIKNYFTQIQNITNVL